MSKIAVMGYGTIGAGVVEVITENQKVISERTSESVEIKYVLDLRDFPGGPVEKLLVKDYKIIVDSEDYRMRHEEYIVRNAFKSAEYVRKTGKSKLLEPMNPFERRLIHTALNDFNGVETKSEGEGLYKQVRIIPVKND